MLGVLVNLIPDYLSLLETRLIIKWMSKNTTFFRILILLILDIIATALIYFIIVLLILPIFIYVEKETSLKEIFSESLIAFFSALTFSDKNNSIWSVFLYSTFFTSIWVWLYALSGFLERIVNQSKMILNFLKDHLSIEDKPLRSMGFISGIILTFIYLAGGIILLLKST